MSRPRKFRKVCFMPENRSYGPIEGKDCHRIVTMSLDEFEAIRLIDFEGLMQEECATRMNVARTTVQRIYNNARTKIADSLVTGSFIHIEGGDYSLYENKECAYRCRRCHHHQAKLAHPHE